MRKWRSIMVAIGFVLVIMAGTYSALNLSFSQRDDNLAKTVHVASSKAKSATKKKIHLVAVGDSLTFGLGDTKSGGYVTDLSQQIKSHYRVKVITSNFGISGNTTSQILTRLKTQKKLRQKLAQADLITLTAGANDLVHLVRAYQTRLTSKNISVGAKTYQLHISQMLTEIRNINPRAPIYLLGIYNPFYVYFPKLTLVQSTMKSWNKISQSVLTHYPNGHFINIDQVMTYPKGSVLAGSHKAAYNPYLYKVDHFHPNHIGYQAITQALWPVVKQTSAKWLDH